MKRKFAIVCAVISVALIFGVLNGCSAPQTGNVELPKEEVTEPGGNDKFPGDSEPLPPVADENGEDLEEGIHTLPKVMVFNTMSTDGDIVSSATVKAQLEPSYTTEKEVTWTLAWNTSGGGFVYGCKDSSGSTVHSSDWYKDKEISDYLELIELDELTVKITMKQPFGCPVILKVVSDYNAALEDECKIHCMSKPVLTSVVGFSFYDEVPLKWKYEGPYSSRHVWNSVELKLEHTLGSTGLTPERDNLTVEWGFSDEALSALSALDFEEKTKKTELKVNKIVETHNYSSRTFEVSPVGSTTLSFEQIFGTTFLNNAERMALLRSCAESCAENFFEVTVHWHDEATVWDGSGGSYSISYSEVVGTFSVGIDVDSLVAGG